jgi:hypothetical protein
MTPAAAPPPPPRGPIMITEYFGPYVRKIFRDHGIGPAGGGVHGA